MNKLTIAQLINQTNQTLAREFRVIMAKTELIKHTVNPIKNLWWRFMPGAIVTVKWPVGWTDLDNLGNQTSSADPNDHFRPWLEQNVGRQGWDWDWRLGPITGAQGRPNGPIVLAGDYLEIKFRWGREQYATMFILRYSKWV